MNSAVGCRLLAVNCRLLMKEINLIPQEYVRRKHTRRRTMVWTLLVCASAAMIGSLAYKFEGKITAAKNEEAVLEERAQMVADIRTQLQQANASKAQVARHLKALYVPLKKQVVAELLHVVSVCSGDSIFLTEAGIGQAARPDPLAALQQKRVPETSPSALVLKGYTLAQRDLTNFVSALSDSGRFASVRLKFWRLEQIEETRIVSFEVECEPAETREGI